MTDLPNLIDIVGGNTTEAQFQAAMADFYNFVAQLVVGTPQELNVISSGNIQPTKAFIQVDTEDNAVDDVLDTISTSNIGSKTIFVRSSSNGRVVTLSHNASGSGRMFMTNGLPAILDNNMKVIAFAYNPTTARWEELWRNWGIFTTPADVADVRVQLGLGTASTRNIGTDAAQVPLNSSLGSLSRLNQLNNASQIANALITNNHLAGGIAFAKLANATPNTLLGFNASGVPSLIPRSEVAGQFSRYVEFNTAGEHTFDKSQYQINPNGLVKVQCWGGGGGSGRWNSLDASNGTAAVWSGGSGGYSESIVNANDLNTFTPVIVGAGGTPMVRITPPFGTIFGVYAGWGGDTSFGSEVVAPGGIRGGYGGSQANGGGSYPRMQSQINQYMYRELVVAKGEVILPGCVGTETIYTGVAKYVTPSGTRRLQGGKGLGKRDVTGPSNNIIVTEPSNPGEGGGNNSVTGQAGFAGAPGLVRVWY